MQNAEDKNIVKSLREKTDAADLKRALKHSLVGYSKKSVNQYLLLLHEQQRAAEETFKLNLELLFAEKESLKDGLKAENEIIKEKLLKKELEYKNLSDSLLLHGPNDANETGILHARITSLETELNNVANLYAKLESENNELKSEKDGLLAKILQVEANAITQAEVLAVKKVELIKQRDTNIELLTASDALRSEISYLKSIHPDDKLQEQADELKRLTADINKLAELVETYKSENHQKDMVIENLTGEIESLSSSNGLLSQTLEKLSSQNDKLVRANLALTEKLKEEYGKTIELINEKASIEVERIVAMKKLDTAEAELSDLIRKYGAEAAIKEKDRCLKELSNWEY